jgi:putative peptidoglycan lipid II flippase
MLAFMLRRRGYFAPDAQLKRRLPRMALATLIMGLALWGLMHALEPWLVGGSGSTRLLAFVVLVVAGLVLYGLAALLTGAADLKEARRLIGKSPG